MRRAKQRSRALVVLSVLALGPLGATWTCLRPCVSTSSSARRKLQVPAASAHNTARAFGRRDNDAGPAPWFEARFRPPFFERAWKSERDDDDREPRVYETRQVDWSSSGSDLHALPLLEESPATAHFGAAVVSALAGFLLPGVGRFGDPVLLGYLGFMASTGELGVLQRRYEIGAEFANLTDWFGRLLTEAGAMLIRSYNFLAMELRGIHSV